MSDRFVIISGCSGGGKSTLIDELARRGFATVPEPGRRIVREEMACGGSALPWINFEAFVRRAIALARADFEKVAAHTGFVFFDRGLIDAAAALEHVTDEPISSDLIARYRYNRCVFLTSPWPEIYLNDAERKHSFDAAVAEYERLAGIYPTLGYETHLLPKTTVAARADFILARLNKPARPARAPPPCRR